MSATVLVVDADLSNCANWDALLLSEGCEVTGELLCLAFYVSPANDSSIA